MTKQESLEFKGIAILLMLLLHLFNTQERVAECTTFINFWNHKPLVFALSRVGSFCVPLYIFLSGYGLFTLYEKTQEHTMSPIRRSLKLFTQLLGSICNLHPYGMHHRPRGLLPLH